MDVYTTWNPRKGQNEMWNTIIEKLEEVTGTFVRIRTELPTIHRAFETTRHHYEP